MLDISFDQVTVSNDNMPGNIIRSPDSDIHYLSWGGGDQVILALHKVSGGAEPWMEPLRYLENDFRIVAPDLRGHGYSMPKSRGFSPDDFCRDLVYLIEYLDLKNITLLGHSFGARLALELTEKLKGRLKAIVCVEPPLSGPRKAPYPYNLQSAIDWRRGVIREGVEFCVRRNPTYTLAQAKLRTKYGVLCQEDVLKAVWHYFNAKSMDKFAVNLRVPTLLLRGSKGVISAEEANLFSGLSKHIRLKTMEGGHNLPWENSTLFCSFVTTFLKKVSQYDVIA